MKLIRLLLHAWFSVVIMALVVSSYPTLAEAKRDEVSIVTALHFNADGSRLVVGFASGKITFWDVKNQKKIWEADSNWQQTQPLAIKLGKKRIDDRIVIAAQEKKPKSLSSFRDKLPVQRIFFRENENQILVTERFGGIRLYQASDGSLINTLGVFFSVLKGQQLETLGDTDYDSATDKLVITGALMNEVYTIDLSKAFSDDQTSMIVLEDMLARYEVNPPTSFMIMIKTGLEKSPAASNIYLYTSSGQDKFDAIRFCGQNVVAVSGSGRLVIWNSTGSKNHVRILKNAITEHAERTDLLCVAGTQFITALSTTSQGSLQIWDNTDVTMIKKGGQTERGNYSYIDYDPISGLVVTGDAKNYVAWNIVKGEIYESNRVCNKTNKAFFSVAAIDRAHGTLAIYEGGEIFFLKLPDFTISGRLGLRNSKTKTKMSTDCK
ncbi:hypothetical protein [Citrobacter enshiensis]|uniref:hypothetical protein n=1 Tax=Citrobacter enshiensis TaxID=2971264 RepID=UPI0023E859CE|nr:hypothetical protein [Citrobacter enshiensis]WET39898.1 hypothetical protein P2W74_18310 [Citrobacter enshiensis]